MAGRILIVEDEATLRENLVRYLELRGYQVTGCDSAEGAVSLGVEFDVALLDLRLPGKDGLSLAAELLSRNPGLMILMMTAYGTVDSVVDALHTGVHDYLVKPVSLRDVAHRVSRLCEHRRLLRENSMLRQRLLEKPARDRPISQSHAFSEVLSFVEKVAQASSTVLFEGESGAGKEVVARALHDASPRAKGPFVAVNMAAIPESLAESHLFGHERGSFTGASVDQPGVFRAAAGGTLLLDEIGDMPMPQQAKLLRALETREVYPVGGSRPLPFDCRVVAATNSDLSAMVKEKRFREDLYYRLSAIRVRVPPLRERPDDIPPLAQHLLVVHALAHRRPVVEIDGAAMQRLIAYRWPGNVRELSNVVERAVVVCTTTALRQEDLPAEVLGAAARDDGGAYHRALASYERELLRGTLERTGGDRQSAARELGVSLATLYRRVEKLGLKGAA